MSTKVWLGGAAKKAQVDRVIVPRDVESGMVIRASIGYKSITYTVLSTDDRDDVVDAIVTKWNSSSKYEFAEVTAAVEYDDSYDEAVRTGGITLTADSPGTPFVVSWSIGSSSGNERQTIELMGTVTGGTFTLTNDDQTTADLDFDATAAEVQAALEAISNIGAGNVSVAGDNGGSYMIEFTGSLAETNVPPLSGDPSGLTGVNEQQTITLATATGGTFILLFNGVESADLDFDATAAEVQAALEAMSNIGAGNASVAGPDGGPWVITFQSGLGKSDQPLIEVDGTNLTGGLDAGITTTQAGVDGGGNQRFVVWPSYYTTSSPKDGIVNLAGDDSVTAGTFDLTFHRGNTITDIPYDVTVKELQALVDANTTSVKIYVLAGGSSGSGNANARLSEGDNFVLMYPSFNNPAFNSGSYLSASATIDSSSLTGGTFAAFYTEYGAEYGYVADHFTSDEYPKTYRLVFGGQSTGEIPFWATAGQIQAALEEIPAFTGNVTVLDNVGTGALFYFELTGSLANTASYISFSGDRFQYTTPNIYGGYNELIINVDRQWVGAAGTNETQQLSISGSPASGQFALNFEGENTDLLDYDSTAAEIQTALEGLSGISSGNVDCTGGPLPGTPIDIEFIGLLNSSNVSEIEIVGGGLVDETQSAGSPPYINANTTATPISHVTLTQSEGPNDWTTIHNWSTAELPVDGDKVYIIDNAYSILYGLDQASVTLAELHIEQTYSGLIGLPVINVNSEDATISYPEYRDQYLKIGATNVYIGDKDGDGSQRLKINFGSVQTTILVTNSGGRLDDATPPIQFLGTHASNVLNINRGDVAIAFYPGEVSAFPTIRQAFIDNAEADATLYVGDDVTLTSIYKSGGIATLKSATTLIDQTAGTLTIEEGAHAEINSFAGQVYYNSIDTLSLIDISGDTTLSFDQDRRPKDVTLIKVNGSEPEVYDQSNAIASPKVNLERGATNQQLYFGSKILLTISSIS